ncbi:nuclear speckle splicing regulatory protein 1-like [Cynara cardunculus var. scolymus]|uniref:nuclear speckle splicing regulatory protein 1-like n=1 Tax=Cynara cardunculus var. scolymus TaxID=59895 RepID=UPI000D62D451|nr:nuclear speckle splicing regulatory protein 1-like [Cynara cardunculus var. scolymus]
MKYGLNLRVQSSQQKKQPTRPPRPVAPGFGDDDEDDIEREISRQASKNKALKDVEEQHKKALEEDPSVFDYDGVYDEMKEKAVRPVAQDRQERKPRYIQALMDKAKVREREHEIIYERKLAKERTKEDHLFADKDKFVTSAYKKKLAEQAKWLEEDRLRQLREDKEDITKKGDMTEFYFNLSKNVAFGAEDGKATKPTKQTEESEIRKSDESLPSKVNSREENQGEPSAAGSKERSESVEPKPVLDSRKQEVLNDSQKQESETEGVTAQPPTDHHKRNQDALAAAKERFLARKKTKVNV